MENTDFLLKFAPNHILCNVCVNFINVLYSPKKRSNFIDLKTLITLNLLFLSVISSVTILICCNHLAMTMDKTRATVLHKARCACSSLLLNLISQSR